MWIVCLMHTCVDWPDGFRDEYGSEHAQIWAVGLHHRSVHSAARVRWTCSSTHLCHALCSWLLFFCYQFYLSSFCCNISFVNIRMHKLMAEHIGVDASDSVCLFVIVASWFAAVYTWWNLTTSTLSSCHRHLLMILAVIYRNTGIRLTMESLVSYFAASKNVSWSWHNIPTLKGEGFADDTLKIVFDHSLCNCP